MPSLAAWESENADIARRDSDRLTSDIKSAIRDIDNLSEVLDAAIKSGMILPPYSTQIHETVKRLKKKYLGYDR